ncbi:MAG: tRNA dimethylallyltransferase [Chlamydiae bacterium]|nr:tRNA dimethylallyltransferase [Chlamydiota bacterium]
MPNHFEETFLSPEYKKMHGIAFGKMPRAIVLAGPTGVGKTVLSLQLAKIMGAEIVSCDSMQVYKGMDIGTAKPSILERNEIPHHLIDIREVKKPINVVEFFQEAKKATESIVSRNRIPIFVGGTGFYIQALIHGPPIGPPADANVRKLLHSDLERFSIEALYDRICKLDPEYAKDITPFDKHKILRALEIMAITHKKVSDFHPKKFSKGLELDFHCWFLSRSRKALYERIEQRCDQMIKIGFLEEMEDLVQKGLQTNVTASNAIGYRQALDFLHSKRTEEEFHDFIAKFKQKTRQYAKKQFTWFRKQKEFRWLDLEKYSQEAAIQAVLLDFERR